MPELPECEANRRRVEAQCLDRTIAAVRLGNDTAHVDLPGKADPEALVGRRFTRTRRHGKAIFAGSASGPRIAVSLGMTGSLRPFDADEAAPDHARIAFEFEGNRRLAFRCPRKLGRLSVAESPEDYVAEKGLGPDAMEIDREAFARTVGGSRGAVKPALMSQRQLAGIGNLWSDETLYRASLYPDARADGLDPGHLDTLFDAMRDVLGGVLDTDAVYADLPGDWPIHRREAGAECPRCGGTIAKTKVGGRTAYHCPKHQEGTG